MIVLSTKCRGFVSILDPSVLRQSRYEEARLQLVSLSTSPEDEEYFLGSRRFWSKEELGAHNTLPLAPQLTGESSRLQRMSPAGRHQSRSMNSLGEWTIQDTPYGATGKRRQRKEYGSPYHDEGWRIRDPPGRKGPRSDEHLVGQDCYVYALGKSPRRRFRRDRNALVAGNRGIGRMGAVAQMGGSEDDKVQGWVDGQAAEGNRPRCGQDSLETEKSSRREPCMALTNLVPEDINSLLCERQPLPATTIVCAAVVYLLSPDESSPQDFCWPQGFEAVARPAEKFLQTLQTLHGAMVSSSKARILKPLLQRQDVLPVVIEQHGGHTVAR